MSADGGDRHREVARTRLQVDAGAGNVRGKPAAVRERDHVVLVALPDRHPARRGRRAGIPSRRGTPGRRRASQRCRCGSRRSGSRPCRRRTRRSAPPCRRRRQAAERGDDLVAGDPASALPPCPGTPTALPARARRCRTPRCSPAPSRPGSPGPRPCTGRPPPPTRRPGSGRQQRGAAERVRATAGEADRDEFARADRVEDSGHVGDDVADRAAGSRRGVLVARPRRLHHAQARARWPPLAPSRSGPGPTACPRAPRG